jgi:hypothetical protein
VVRWINLALAVVLATMLLIQLTRSREPAPTAGVVVPAAPIVKKERAGRLSHRMEMRAAIEEAQRRQRERLRGGPSGPPVLDPSGRPIMD